MEFRFFAGLMYGTVLMLFYAYIAYVIRKNKSTFNSTFFRLFYFGFWMNLVTYINSYITLRIPQFTGKNDIFAPIIEYFNNDSDSTFPLCIFHMLHYHFAYMQYSYSGLSSFNRCHAVLWPSNNFWEKHFYKLLLFPTLAPFFATGLIFMNSSFFQYRESEDQFYLDTTLSRKIIYYPLFVYIIIITITNIVLNFCAILYLVKMKKPLMDSAEKRLFSMALAQFVIDLLLFSLSAPNVYFATCETTDMENAATWTSWIYFLTPYASDGLTLNPPILMFSFSTMIKTKCVEELPIIGRIYKNRRVGVVARRQMQTLA